MNPNSETPGLPSSRKPAARPPMEAIDFDRSPFLVIWETTQACDLACLHCRAEARSCRDAGELSTDEARKLFRDVRRFGRVLLVLTGGDPAKRPDTVELIRYGSGLGLRMGMTPSATPLLTPEFLGSVAEAGLARLAMSLDGASPEAHDRFRGVPGSFDWTWRALTHGRALGLSTQVNTTVSRQTLGDLDRTADLLLESGISLWSVFFLVPTGRARATDLISPEEAEEVMHRLAELSEQVPFDIKTTAAPHYRRVLLQRQVAERRRLREAGETVPPLASAPGTRLGGGAGRARGVNDGNGFVFVSHRGEVFPSGFLPVSGGNVRTGDLVDIYRNSPLFTRLRDPELLRGKCGVCEYRMVCGGSRARAYAESGDVLGPEPICSYQPPRWVASAPARARASLTLPTIPGRPV